MSVKITRYKCLHRLALISQMNPVFPQLMWGKSLKHLRLSDAKLAPPHPESEKVNVSRGARADGGMGHVLPCC